MIRFEAEGLAAFLGEKSLTLAAAESCTAGLVADAVAAVPGASKVFWGSLVCYTAEAKKTVLGVGDEIIRRGLVSSETAAAMALGVLEKSGADGAVSVTGLAGPDGDGSDTPVGTVWIGTALKNGPVRTRRFHFRGSRGEVRARAARAALREIFKRLQEFF